ncbi:DUF1593 domain-containing protein, partial [Prevotella sp. MGM1]|uniref:DUF1593 domain-containing protein n=1 Tax=Prevotella sp. MGM1 TaxID=2033405 RepID=UPI001E4AAD2D
RYSDLTRKILVLAAMLLTTTCCILGKDKSQNTRLIVTTDIGGSDPDDIQSLVHLMVMLNDVDLEGIISQHAWVPYGTGADEYIEAVIAAYEQTLPNLTVHDKRYPEAESLRTIVKVGQHQAAMAGVGEGKDSDGSEWIIEVVDRKDKRPVWIAAWSGMNTLAQALWKISHTRTKEDVEKFVSKIRVYDVLGQDDAGAWIAKNFPQLTYIRNKEIYGWPKDDAWYRKYVQEVGSLGKAYASRIWATEGDTPSFLYCVNNGLNSPENIDYGGWGGRFSLEKKADIPSMDWVKRNNLDEMQYSPYLMHGAESEGNMALTRWAQDVHNDFKARMQWSVTNSYSEANHHPVAIVNGDKAQSIIRLKGKAGHSLTLDASKSYDPDHDELSYNWEYYKAPSTYQGEVKIEGADSVKPTIIIPQEAKGKAIHIILRVSDNDSEYPLCKYRRIVITVCE